MNWVAIEVHIHLFFMGFALINDGLDVMLCLRTQGGSLRSFMIRTSPPPRNSPTRVAPLALEKLTSKAENGEKPRLVRTTIVQMVGGIY